MERAEQIRKENAEVEVPDDRFWFLRKIHTLFDGILMV